MVENEDYDIVACGHADTKEYVLSPVGSRHVFAILHACRHCKESIFNKSKYTYGEIEIILRPRNAYDKIKVKEVSFINQDKTFVWGKYKIENRSYDIYPEGAVAYIPENYTAKSVEFIPMECRRHNNFHWSRAYVPSNACPDCHGEMGVRTRDRETWQSMCDEIHGEGEYSLYLWEESVAGKKHFSVYHRKCGTHYETTLSNLVTQGQPCGYCSNGRPWSQEQIEDKAKKIGYSGLVFEYKRVRLPKGAVTYEIKYSCKEHGEIEEDFSKEDFNAGRVYCKECDIVRWRRDNEKTFYKAEKVVSPLYDIDHWLIYDYDNVTMPHGYCIPHDYHFHSKIGCPICVGLSVRDTPSLQEYLYDKMGTDLDYSLAEWCGKDSTIKIICPLHGESEISFNEHRKGRVDCPDCGELKRGWGRSGFYSTGETSHLYLIKIKHRGEYGEREFLKVGLARKLGNRFRRMWKDLSSNGAISLEIEVVDLYKGPANTLFDIESDIKWRSGIRTEHSDVDFNGYTECFNLDVEGDILGAMKDLLGGGCRRRYPK